MKNILVLAYCVSPTRGSEYSVAWNYIIRMSKYHKLTVLYGMSGYHMGDTNEVEELSKTKPLKNVCFIPVHLNKKTKLLDKLSNYILYFYYLAFNCWHKSTFTIAQQLIQKENFDLVHMLGPTGFREPGYLWKLGLPYIWGPIGGTNNYPPQLLKAVESYKGKLRFLMRTPINQIQLRTSLRVKQALKKSNILLTATTKNQQNLYQIHQAKSEWLPENGITDENIELDKLKFDTETTHLIWIGRIDEFKAIILILKALEKISGDNFLLHIVGDGVLRKKMEKYAVNKGINHLIKWHGNIPRNDVFSIMSQSHLHIITSLGETNPTVIWEAMSRGVPTITLDHCGMHDTVCEKCGIKIPIISYEQVINDLSIKLQELINNPRILKTLSEGVLECAQKFQWDQREVFWNEIYDRAISNFNKGITAVP